MYSCTLSVGHILSVPFLLSLLALSSIPTWCENQKLLSPSSQRLPASPRQEARFPRGIAFPPHVASPIRSDLSSPAKEWDRLVAGASPLDCLSSAAITRAGQQHGPRGEAGCWVVHPGRRVFLCGLGTFFSFFFSCLVSSWHRWLAQVFARSKVNAAGPSAERGKERGNDRTGCAQTFCPPSFAPGWVGPWGWSSDPVFRCYRGR